MGAETAGTQAKKQVEFVELLGIADTKKGIKSGGLFYLVSSGKCSKNWDNYDLEVPLQTTVYFLLNFVWK